MCLITVKVVVHQKTYLDLYKDKILDLFHRQHWKQGEIVTWFADNKDLKIDTCAL